MQTCVTRMNLRLILICPSNCSIECVGAACTRFTVRHYQAQPYAYASSTVLISMSSKLFPMFQSVEERCKGLPDFLFHRKRRSFIQFYPIQQFSYPILSFQWWCQSCWWVIHYSLLHSASYNYCVQLKPGYSFTFASQECVEPYTHTTCICHAKITLTLRNIHSTLFSSYYTYNRF